MSERLQQFVHDTLDTAGAQRAEVAPGAGVWRATLPESAARFLGRAEQECLLYTFDLQRWEEGARLECLTAQSPLVQRLQDYALARGAVAVAHLPGESYQPYLIARFSARMTGEHIRDDARWLGVNLASGQPLRIKGDPLLSPNLREGHPPSDWNGARLTELDIDGALERLAGLWNEECAARAQAAQSDIEQRYRQSAEAIAAALPGRGGKADRECAWDRTSRRMRIEVECHLEMAILLWLPATARDNSGLLAAK